MSFWSSQTLSKHLPSIIEPFDLNKIESASYNLTLGNEVHISFLPDTPHKDRKKITLKESEGTAIPPGQFAFLITAENVKIPKNVVAFISIKFKAKAKGLINVSGFHVDPGYNGKLIFAVYNAGSLNFHVTQGDALFSIWFAELDEEDEKPRTQKGFTSIPSDLMNAPDNSSLFAVTKRIDAIEKKVERYIVIQTILATLAVSLTIALVKYIIEQLW